MDGEVGPLRTINLPTLAQNASHLYEPISSLAGQAVGVGGTGASLACGVAVSALASDEVQVSTGWTAFGEVAAVGCDLEKAVGNATRAEDRT